MKLRHALTPTWRRTGLVLAAALSAELAAPPVGAQMADPTRPAYAGAVNARGVTSGGAANQPQASAYVSPNLPLPGRSKNTHAPPDPGGPASTLPGTPRLSSVMVGPPSVACAVIDGQVVRIGERIRGDTLMSVDRTGVLLKGSTGSTRLNLMSRTQLPAAATPLVAAAPELAASTPTVTPPADTPGAARKEMP
jgi:hypothetical protein